MAKRSLGQNFLKSRKALEEIRDAADLTNLDIVLEIGPGRGALTEILLTFAGKVIAVEKDDQLYEELKQKFSKYIDAGALDLIHGDILDFDPEVMRFYKDLNYKIVANIPYNITGAIIRKFLSADYQPEQMVLLVQKEVAERIARSKKESILSISVKAYGTPHYISTVKAGSFSPAPRVDSAILSINDISKKFFKDFSEMDFFRMLHAGFSSPRKKLSSNLKKLFSDEKIEEAFEKLDLDENARAEDVNLEIWQGLAKELI